jgi:hypothetical protein
MSKTIAKLNKLKNTESFIQINTVKGFKYIDKAGEIVNQYYQGDIVPVFEMNLNGLIIKEPKDKIQELKITPQIIWAKFNEIDSLDMIKGLFFKESKTILDILEVEQISRIGWRNHFVFEFKDKKEQEKYFKNLTSFNEGVLSIVRFEIDTKKDFSLNLIIQSVVKNDENQTPGVLFDVDIFQKGKIKIDNVQKILKSFMNYLREEKSFLSVLNNTFIKK